MDILKRFTRTADTSPAAIEQRRAEALQAYEKARGELGAASLDYDAAAVEVARKALAKAEAALVEADSALDAQRSREAAAIAAKARDEMRARWSEAEAIAKRRALIAGEVEATAGKLAAQTGELLRLSSDLLHKVPRQPHDAVSLLGIDAVTRAIRLQLFKAGLAWAAHWPWPREELPPLADYVAGGNVVALRERGAE